MSDYIKSFIEDMTHLGLNNLSYKDVDLNYDSKQGLDFGVHLIAFNKANSLTIGKLKQVKQAINNMHDDMDPPIKWIRDGDHIVVIITYFA